MVHMATRVVATTNIKGSAAVDKSALLLLPHHHICLVVKSPLQEPIVPKVVIEFQDAIRAVECPTVVAVALSTGFWAQGHLCKAAVDSPGVIICSRGSAECTPFLISELPFWAHRAAGLVWAGLKLACGALQAFSVVH